MSSLEPIEAVIERARAAMRVSKPLVCERCRSAAADGGNMTCTPCTRALATTETIGARYKWARFDSPLMLARANGQANIDRVRALVGVPLVMFVGPAGSSKTSLATALLRASCEAAGVSGVWADARSLAESKGAWKHGTPDPETIARAKRSRWCLIDEVGAESGYGVAEVIHARDLACLPMIITTVEDSAALVLRYGDGIARRVWESAKLVQLGG
jgi:hypothetical protein